MWLIYVPLRIAKLALNKSEKLQNIICFGFPKH